MHILIPVDGSEASLDAVRHVLALRHQGLAVSCVLTNVQDAPHLYEVVMTRDMDTLAGASHDAAEDAMAAARGLLEAADVPVDCEIAMGEAGPQIVDVAERCGCHLIVMGSQGMNLLGAARLGTVSQWVLQHASVPVTVVRHEDPDTDIEDDLEPQVSH
jgi:nucleotide-binding universal stress UspA family protein